MLPSSNSVSNPPGRVLEPEMMEVQFVFRYRFHQRWDCLWPLVRHHLQGWFSQSHPGEARRVLPKQGGSWCRTGKKFTWFSKWTYKYLTSKFFFFGGGGGWYSWPMRMSIVLSPKIHIFPKFNLKFPFSSYPSFLLEVSLIMLDIVGGFFPQKNSRPASIPVHPWSS